MVDMQKNKSPNVATLANKMLNEPHKQWIAGSHIYKNDICL